MAIRKFKALDYRVLILSSSLLLQGCIGTQRDFSMPTVDKSAQKEERSTNLEYDDLSSVGSVSLDLLASKPLFAAVDSLLEEAINEKVIPGAVLLVTQHGHTLHEKAYGFAWVYEYGLKPLDNPEYMAVDHRFDLASLTKVVATTMGIMLLVDDGSVELEAPLNRYLPSFRGLSKDSITVRHLLTHTAGLFPWKPVYYHATNPKEAFAYLCDLPLASPVGKARHYSDLGFMLLGYLIEKVSGSSLGHFLSTRLYAPLGLKATSFNPPRGDSFLAATSHGNPFEKRMVADDDFGYLCDENPEDFNRWREYVLVGEVNDGNAFHAHKGVAGHAGLFSTARDLSKLLDIMLNKGSIAGRTYISREVVEEFISADQFGHGLGWAMSDTVIPVNDLPPGSFGHTGFTGTYILGVPEYNLGIILLTNRQHYGLNTSGYYPSLSKLRGHVSKLVLQAIFETSKN